MYMGVDGCSQPVPLDQPSLDLTITLKDGFNTTTVGRYLLDHPYVVSALWPPGADAPTTHQNISSAGT